MTSISILQRIASRKSRVWLPIGVVMICAATPVGCNRDGQGSANDASTKLPVLINSIEPKNSNSGRQTLGLHTRKSWMEFATQPRQLEANGLAIWLINVWQKGKPATKARNRVRDFHMINGKSMNLTIVSKDLSYFNRVQPVHKGNGHFMIGQTLPRGGNFKVYGDYTPLNEQREVAWREFKVKGEAPADVKIVVDKFTNGVATKSIVSKPAEEPNAEGGDTYTVKLTVAKPVVGRSSELRFSIADAQGKPVRDLMSYAGAIGHAVALSSDTEIYVDVRSEESSTRFGATNNFIEEPVRLGGPDVVFLTVFPTGGLYKVWGQFQHNGRIITAPFVIGVAEAPAKKAQP